MTSWIELRIHRCNIISISHNANKANRSFGNGYGGCENKKQRQKQAPFPPLDNQDDVMGWYCLFFHSEILQFMPMWYLNYSIQNLVSYVDLIVHTKISNQSYRSWLKNVCNFQTGVSNIFFTLMLYWSACFGQKRQNYKKLTYFEYIG